MYHRQKTIVFVLCLALLLVVWWWWWCDDATVALPGRTRVRFDTDIAQPAWTDAPRTRSGTLIPTMAHFYQDCPATQATWEDQGWSIHRWSTAWDAMDALEAMGGFRVDCSVQLKPKPSLKKHLIYSAYNAKHVRSGNGAVEGRMVGANSADTDYDVLSSVFFA